MKTGWGGPLLSRTVTHSSSWPGRGGNHFARIGAVPWPPLAGGQSGPASVPEKPITLLKLCQVASKSAWLSSWYA